MEDEDKGYDTDCDIVIHCNEVCDEDSDKDYDKDYDKRQGTGISARDIGW